MICPKRSTKCRGRDPPPPHVADQGADVVDRSRSRPTRQLRRTVEEAGHDEQRATDSDGGHDAQNGAQEFAVAAAGDGIEHEVERAHDQVGDREGDAIATEGLGRREGCDEHPGDGGEHRDPDAAFFRVERVRQPREGGPRPPQDAEQQPAPEHTAPGRVTDEQRGDLSECEDENEVEEEL